MQVLGLRLFRISALLTPSGRPKRFLEIAAQLDCKNLRIAIILGDDLRNVFSSDEIRNHPTIEGLEINDQEIIAANAYLEQDR